jgi:hypothetical protein
LKVLAATSFFDPRISKHDLTQEFVLDPSRNVSINEIPCLTREENRLLLQSYRVTGHILADDLSEEYLETKYFLSGGNPQKLFRACKFDNLY